MRMREGWRALKPYVQHLAGAGRWFALSVVLIWSTLLGSLGLLGMSGWFLTAAAIAGLSVATAIQFNYFPLAAGVRFFAILRTSSRWAERVVTHEGTFRQIAGLRVMLYQQLSLLSPSQLGGHHGGALLGNLVRDVDALDNLYPRLVLPAIGAMATLLAMTLLIGWKAPALSLLGILLIFLSIVVLPILGWNAGKRIAPQRIALQAGLRTELLDCIDGIEAFSLHEAAWTRQRIKVLTTSFTWLQLQLQLVRHGAWLRALVSIWVGLTAWAALGWGVDCSFQTGFRDRG